MPAIGLQEAEIFQTLPIGVLQLDETLRVTWASEQFLRLFHCRKEDIEGKVFEKLISLKDRKGQIRFYSQLTQNGNQKIDTHVSLRIGTQDYLVHLRMVRREDAWIIVYIEDLLGSRNLTFDLLWDEEKFSNIVLSSGEGIVILDHQDRIIEFNRKFFEFMQFKSEHGVMISEPALIEKDLFDLLGNSFVNFRNSIHHKVHRFKKHQEVIWYNNHCFEVLSNPTVIPIKGFTGNCIVFKDITSQKISEELTKRLNAQSHELEIKNQTLKITLKELEDNNNRLNLLNQEKNYLMGVVAHDLRAPLNQIIGLTNIIVMERDQLSQVQKECSDKILESAFRLRNLINKILDQEAIENETLNVDLKPVDPGDVLMAVVNNLCMDADRKQIRLLQEIAPPAFNCMLDINYLRLIYENVLSNAIKFSAHGSQIEVKFYAADGKSVTEISDGGPGFTNEELPRLFMKFQKFSARPTGNEESHGLGLSIVKRYVDIMKGSIACENVPGAGARFIITFDQCT
jgi:signal transduction histidine kinase/PAS domain-containing protein